MTCSGLFAQSNLRGQEMTKGPESSDRVNQSETSHCLLPSYHYQQGKPGAHWEVAQGIPSCPAQQPLCWEKNRPFSHPFSALLSSSTRRRDSERQCWFLGMGKMMWPESQGRAESLLPSGDTQPIRTDRQPLGPSFRVLALAHTGSTGRVPPQTHAASPQQHTRGMSQSYFQRCCCKG